MRRDAQILAEWEERLRREGARILTRTRSMEPDPDRVGSLACPQSVNDKFLWRKLVDRDPRFVTVCDKLASKAWMARAYPELRQAETLWIGTDLRTVPDAVWAQDIVIKTNHGSGANVYVQGGQPGRDEVARKMQTLLARDHGAGWGEWGYLGVPRRLFAEEIIGSGPGRLDELKLHVFGPRPYRMNHMGDRYIQKRAQLYELSDDDVWEAQPFRHVPDDLPLERPLPASHRQAHAVAARIGAGFDHIRVDLYTDGTDLWFGELTAYHMGGWLLDCGHDPTARLARAWDLRRSWFLTTRHRDPDLQAYADALARTLG